MTGVPTTTRATLRAEFVTLLEAIVPTELEFRDQTWRHLEDDSIRARGSDIRLFRIISGIDSIDPEGVYSSEGAEVVHDMVIEVAYGGINGNEANDLISRDMLDIWQVFHPKPGGLGQSIAGFISFGGEFVTTEIDDPESNALVVQFITEVHYKAAI